MIPFIFPVLQEVSSILKATNITLTVCLGCVKKLADLNITRHLLKEINLFWETKLLRGLSLAVKKVPVLLSIWARCFDIAFSKMRMQLLLLDLVAAWHILSMAGL